MRRWTGICTLVHSTSDLFLNRLLCDRRGRYVPLGPVRDRGRLPTWPACRDRLSKTNRPCSLRICHFTVLARSELQRLLGAHGSQAPARGHSGTPGHSRTRNPPLSPIVTQNSSSN